jgi:hypothetical protein
METIVVSRHPATVQFIAGCMRDDCVDSEVVPGGIHLFGRADTAYSGEDYGFVPVIFAAYPDDVMGKVVYGNLPLHLASLTSLVRAVEFEGAPPRGQEYSLEDMMRAGARLVDYVVKRA